LRLKQNRYTYRLWSKTDLFADGVEEVVVSEVKSNFCVGLPKELILELDEFVGIVFLFGCFSKLVADVLVSLKNWLELWLVLRACQNQLVGGFLTVVGDDVVYESLRKHDLVGNSELWSEHFVVIYIIVRY